MLSEGSGLGPVYYETRWLRYSAHSSFHRLCPAKVFVMRVLHVIAGGRNGGAERFFTDLVAALSRRGVTQHAVTRDYLHRIASLEDAGCEVSTARLGSALDLFSARTVRAAEHAFQPDAMLAWMSRGATYAAAAERTPVIGRLGGYYDLKYYTACRHLICNTPDLVRHCVEGGWPRDRVSYIPNFSPQSEAKAVKRSDLDTPDDATVLLVLARLVVSKGVDIAIEAFSQLPDSFYFWIAGEGPERAALEARARSLGVKDRIRFLGWRDDRDALIKSADICVVSSRQEPFGNVIVNAWVNETPVVAAASEGPRHLIADRENGMLVPPDDPEGLAAALSQLANNGDLRANLVAGGTQAVQAAYSEDAVCTSYLAAFDALRS